MRKRIVVDAEKLRNVKKELRGRGIQTRKINEKIGADINELIRSRKSMDLETFYELQKLYGKKLEHEEKYLINGAGLVDKISTTRDAKLAELTGIILGDGNIYAQKQTEEKTSQYAVSVTLHEKEKELIKRTEELLTEVLDK